MGVKTPLINLHSRNAHFQGEYVFFSFILLPYKSVGLMNNVLTGRTSSCLILSCNRPVVLKLTCMILPPFSTAAGSNATFRARQQESSGCPPAAQLWMCAVTNFFRLKSSHPPHPRIHSMPPNLRTSAIGYWIFFLNPTTFLEPLNLSMFNKATPIWLYILGHS